MLSVRLDSPVPLVDQIAGGVRQAIAAGAIRPGDPLPTVRQLAADLGVNLNTVARAYRTLESAGLVTTRRGRGTRVASVEETPRGTTAQVRESLAARLRAVLADARLAGLDRKDIGDLVEHELRKYFAPPQEGGAVGDPS
ncbi:MAG: GntR family transcriptional regulator [Planctomycetota bacterium]|nr:GntR family transcriptional regulator [Planctomycetota bacterium]